MAEAKAKLSTYRQSPRKVRVVANLVRGKRVADAIDMLTFTTKRPSDPIKKLISSAVANAKGLGLNEEKLVVKEIMVDEGATLYRRRPRSRGMANPIRKRTSHVSVTLEEREPKVKKTKPAKAKKVEETKEVEATS